MSMCKIKKLILTPFCLLLVLLVKGQNHKIDSLKAVLKITREDTVKVYLLNMLSEKCYHIPNVEAGINYALKAKKIAEKNNDKSGIAFSLLHIGEGYSMMGNYDEALKQYWSAIKINEKSEDQITQIELYINAGVVNELKDDYTEALTCFTKGLEVAKKINDKYGIASAYHLQAEVNNRIGNYARALKDNFLALKIFERINNKYGVGNCYLSIGQTYKRQQDYESAIKMFTKSITLFEQIGATSSVFASYTNIADTYYEQANYTKALGIYNRLFVRSKSDNDKYNMSEISNKIGSIYFQQKRYDDAVKHYLFAIKLANEIDNKTIYISSAIDLGQLYIDLKQIAEASKYLNEELIKIAKSINSMSDLKNSYCALSKLDSLKGHYQQALANYMLYISYRDSIDNKENTRKITQLQMQYEFDKKENTYKTQTKIQALEVNKQKTILYAFVIVFFLLLSILCVILYNYKQKQKLNKELVLKNELIQQQKKRETQALEQKILRTQMTPHFIFNTMSSIKSLIENNKSEAAAGHLEQFAQLTRQILTYSEEEFISLKEEIQLLENYISLLQLMYEGAFTYVITVDENIHLENTLVPPMIAQPFVENAIKHGVAKKARDGNVKIRFYTEIIEGEGTLLLMVEDNGSGLTNQKDASHKSMAISITKRRLERYSNQKNVNITLENKINSLGSVVGARLLIPIPYIYEA